MSSRFDIKSVYLHGKLKEAVFMEQPEGYVAQGKENCGWKIKKGLYGLVQARRTWNEEPNADIVGEGLWRHRRIRRFTRTNQNFAAADSG